MLKTSRSDDSDVHVRKTTTIDSARMRRRKVSAGAIEPKDGLPATRMDTPADADGMSLRLPIEEEEEDTLSMTAAHKQDEDVAVSAAAKQALVTMLQRFGHAYDTLVVNGKGAREVSAQQRYEGELVHGVPQGRGSMTYPDGSIYMYVGSPALTMRLVTCLCRTCTTCDVACREGFPCCGRHRTAGSGPRA